MKAYIGAKIIQAESMSERTFQSVVKGRPENEIDHYKPDKMGYHVVYPDGYHSWSPRAVFEEAYRPLNAGEIIFTIAQEEEARILKAIVQNPPTNAAPEVHAFCERLFLSLSGKGEK